AKITFTNNHPRTIWP
nr:RecName: Full=Thaumatin-like protein [Castanopsis chinensis]